MQAIKPYTQIYKDFDGQKVLQKIEAAARTCYKSEGKIQEDSAAKLVAGLIKSGHEAMLEHASVTVKFVVDRGISHELVRHRLASFAQESTRYCNYSRMTLVLKSPSSFLIIWNTNQKVGTFGRNP